MKYIIFNKQKQDEHFIKEFDNEDDIYTWTVNTLDMSKYWVYYSLEYLLQQHKLISNARGLEDYEFHYIDDIANNEYSFQEILDDMKEFSSLITA